MRIVSYELEDETIKVISETPINGFAVLSTSRPFSGQFRLNGYDKVWITDGLTIVSPLNNLVFDSNVKEHSGSYSTGAGPIKMTVALFDGPNETASLHMTRYTTCWPVTVTAIISVRSHAITRWQLALCYSSCAFPLPWPYAQTVPVYPINTWYLLGCDADYSSFYTRGVLDTSSVQLAPAWQDEESGGSSVGWKTKSMVWSSLATPELINAQDYNLYFGWPQQSASTTAIQVKDLADHDVYTGEWRMLRGSPADCTSMTRLSRCVFAAPHLFEYHDFNSIGIKISSHLIDPSLSDDVDLQIPLAELVLFKDF